MPMWLAGIVAGLIAGIGMAMVAMMVMPAMGKNFLMPVKLMAGTFEGEGAVDGGGGTVMTGMMIHMMMSAVLGLIFALIVAALGWSGFWPLVIGGMVYALIVWVVMEFGILPLVDKVMRERMSPALFAMTHVVYGFLLGLFLFLFR